METCVRIILSSLLLKQHSERPFWPSNSSVIILNPTFHQEGIDLNLHLRGFHAGVTKKHADRTLVPFDNVFVVFD